MIFEDILKEVGGYGKYQKILIGVFLLPCAMIIPWFEYSSVFQTSTPEHWCYVSAVVNSNLSIEEQRQLISPYKDPHCSMHDIDYATILESKNYSIDPQWPIKECDDGWEFDKTYFDQTAVTRWNMVCSADHYSSLVISLMFVGVTIGTPVFGFISDRIGRKPTFLIMAFVICITEVLATHCPIFELYLIFRAMNGLCISTIYSLAFILMLELVKPDIRARVNGLATTAWVIGMCLLPMIAWLTRNWVYLSAVTTAGAALMMLYFKVVPESPSWLIGQERYQEAHDVLSKVSKSNSKTVHETPQLMEIIEKFGEHLKQQKQKQQKPNPLDFVKHPKLRSRLLLITACWMASSMPYYGHQVNARNLGGNEFLNFFYLAAAEMPGSLLAWAVMESIGRRWTAFGSFLVAALSCIVPAVLSDEYQVVAVVSALLAKASTSAAYMTVYLLAPELFPTNMRSVGIAICSTLGNSSTLLAPYIVYFAKYGSSIPFICFAVISMVGAVASLFLPETLGEELPQTVEDVENFISKRSFCSCGRIKNLETEDGPSPSDTTEKKLERNLNLEDPIEVCCRQNKGNSLDSIQGYFSVPAPSYSGIDLTMEQGK